MKIGKLNTILLIQITLIALSGISQMGSGSTVLDYNPPEYSALISQPLVFNYTSTFYTQEFNLFIPLVELNVLNSITLFFDISGDKTTNDGIGVSFISDFFEVEFIIERLFQDGLLYKLSQAFTCTELYSGSLNLTIICEGQTSFSYHTGSFTIYSSTEISPVEVPHLSDTASLLPSIPSWLDFRGSLTSTETRSIKTAFSCSADVENINLTLSFITNDFSAYDRYFEIRRDNTLLFTEDFSPKETMVKSFIVPVSEGLNIYDIDFVVNLCADIIGISAIEILACSFSFDNLLPENTYDWCVSENQILDHVFDLSTFKPFNNEQEQILDISLCYGYYGSFSSPIIYELYSGQKKISSGIIDATLFSETNQLLELTTYTTTYGDTLALLVEGETDDISIFYLSDTCTIEIDAIPYLSANQSLERVLVEEETYSVPIEGVLTLTYFDVFYIDSDYLDCNVSLFIELVNESEEALELVEIDLKFSYMHQVFEETIAYQSIFNEEEPMFLLRGYYKSELTLIVYGENMFVTVKQAKYDLNSTKAGNFIIEPPDIPSIFDDNVSLNVISKKAVISIFAWLDAITLIGFIRHFQIYTRNKKRMKAKDSLYTVKVENDIVQVESFFGINIDKFQRSLLIILSLTYIILKYFVFNTLFETFDSLSLQSPESVELVSLGNISFNIYAISNFVSIFLVFIVLVNSSTSIYYKLMANLGKYACILLIVVVPTTGILTQVFSYKNIQSNGLVWIISNFIILFLVFSIFMLFVRMNNDNTKLASSTYITLKNDQEYTQTAELEEPINSETESTGSIDKKRSSNESGRNKMIVCCFCGAEFTLEFTDTQELCPNCEKSNLFFSE
ncbi:MAG: hypothetical protein KGD64_14410 [Candidatus Heimdallarchaeota archaeon]|nr:hypothetical protein [Candidatus Heimdallarchaeota archaeon]